MATSSQINAFLNDVKSAHNIYFVDRDKDKRTRLQLGITIMDQELIVRSLKESEYHDGPSPDKDPSKSGLVWIFKHNFQGTVLYIKLKEKQIIVNKAMIKCLSCHIDNMI